MFLKSSTMAHTGETHLFLENFFDLQSPSWPRRNPRRKTQAWIKCAGDTPNSSNWNHSRILKCKNPFLHVSNKVQFTSDWFNSETISTRAGFTSETISNLGAPTFFPFLNKYKFPYPFLKFLSSLIPHYISLGDDYDEEDVSADVYRKVLSWNNSGKLQKLSPPSVSTLDIVLMDLKFRNFPPLMFRPPP